MTRYSGTELFRSKRRYMQAVRAGYPLRVHRAAVLVARALAMVGR